MADSARPQPPDRVSILGCSLDLASRDAVRDVILSALQADSGLCHVATLNPEYVMAARADRAFKGALDRSDVATADGVGVVLAARVLHGQAVDRVTGVDLVEWLAEMSDNAPLYLLGARVGVAEQTGVRLKETFPAAEIAGWWSGGTPGAEHDAETRDRIRSSGARSVAVAYGAPGQVLWIDRNRAGLEAAGVRVAVGVGGSFDYLSGVTPRAPERIRRIGLEWLWRLIREPHRWRRQLVLPRFALLVGAERVASIRRR